MVELDQVHGTYELVLECLESAQHELYSVGLDSSLIYRVIVSLIDFLRDLL